MAFIYPTNGSRIYLPVGADGLRQKIVMDIAVAPNVKAVFWYLDEEFVGKTESLHQLTLTPNAGMHTITITDQDGNSKAIWFEVM
jgi:penicillin-binding protein 1C